MAFPALNGHSLSSSALRRGFTKAVVRDPAQQHPGFDVSFADFTDLRCGCSYDRYRMLARFQIPWPSKYDGDNGMKFFNWIKSLFPQTMPQGELTKTDGVALAKDRVRKFTESRLGGQDTPKDLGILLAAIADDPEFEETGKNPLKIIGAELLWTDRKYPLLDHNYINDADRADPSIMANAKAMEDTAKKMKFVIECEDSSLIGYWQPDPETPLEQCALFWLDTEGQYYLAEGKTLSESLTYRALVDGNEDTYRSLRNEFKRLGTSVPKADKTSIFADMDSRAATIGDAPGKFRDQRYEHYRSLQKI